RRELDEALANLRQVVAIGRARPDQAMDVGHGGSDRFAPRGRARRIPALYPRLDVAQRGRRLGIDAGDHLVRWSLGPRRIADGPPEAAIPTGQRLEVVADHDGTEECGMGLRHPAPRPVGLEHYPVEL